jgi:hypothetical protein
VGILNKIFLMTSVGKIAKSTCGLLNVVRRNNLNFSDVEVILATIEERFGGDSSKAQTIIGNIYYNKFSYDADNFGEDDVKFGLMDLVVHIVYFELRPSPFNDRSLVYKIGQLMRDEGFTSKEINGKVYESDDFPMSFFEKYIVKKGVDMIDLNWRLWL